MTNSIVLIRPSGFLWDNTWCLAIQNVAKLLNAEYVDIVTNNDFDINKLEKKSNAQFVLFDNNPFYERKDWCALKESFPNAFITMFSSDTLYYRCRTQCRPDLILETVDAIKEKWLTNPDLEYCGVEHIWWSISESIIKEINNCNLQEVPKDIDFLSLCHKTDGDREKFFNELANKGYPVKHNLNLWDNHEIYKLYSRSWINLGHTTSCWSNGQCRSPKGWRDWISPFCNCILIYDNFCDFKKHWCSVVPQYPYLNTEWTIHLLNKYKQDPPLYKALLEVQKKWAWEHTLEKQLLTILIKYGVIGVS